MFTLPANVSELHSVVCGNLSREVKVGKVHQWHKPSVYSIGIECVSCSPINILYYLLLQYLPSTVTAVLVHYSQAQQNFCTNSQLLTILEML